MPLISLNPFQYQSPSVGDPYFNYVTLLMHMDGVNGSKTFTDSSSYQRTTTVGTNTAITTSFSKFGGASVSIGSGGYINAPNAVATVGSSDFTAECWVYFTANNIGYQPIFANTGTADYQGFVCILETNNTLAAYVTSNGSTWTNPITSSFTPSVNVWTHVALCRSGTNLRLFANGVLVGSASINAATAVHNPSGSFKIGHYPFFPGGSRSFTGYIDDFRMTVGVGRYTAAFNVPQLPFPDAYGIASGEADPYFSNVVMLMNCQSNSFIDLKGHTLNQVGSSSMSSTQTKFASYSLYTNNGSGYLTSADSDDWDFGSGNFTAEAWVYQTNQTGGAGGSYQGVLQQAVYGDFANGSFDMGLGNGVPSGNLHANSINNVAQSSTAISANEWHHLCWERSGTTFRVYVNGVIQGSTSISGAINLSTRMLGIGADPNGQGIFKGYIGPTRITKGVARYNGAFSPPSAAFPDH